MADATEVDGRDEWLKARVAHAFPQLNSNKLNKAWASEENTEAIQSFLEGASDTVLCFTDAIVAQLGLPKRSPKTKTLVFVKPDDCKLTSVDDLETKVRTLLPPYLERY